MQQIKNGNFIVNLKMIRLCSDSSNTKLNFKQNLKIETHNIIRLEWTLSTCVRK